MAGPAATPTARADPRRDHDLSLAYMRGHPAQAARVLESLPDAEAAALFDRAPARLGALVLEAMLPLRAARCLQPLDDARALELLSHMATQPAVALLRHLPEPRRRLLTAGLPTVTAMASTLLLDFSEETLGAWADPDVVLLPPESRAADALARLRQSPSLHPWVFVADAQRRLSGMVSLGHLLAAPEAATLASLAQRPAALLAAFAPLAGSADHPGWQHSSLLPVVEPGDRLVGVLSRDALARALRRSPGPELTIVGDAALPLLAARGYWSLLTGLLDVGLSLLPKVPPLAPGQPPGQARPDPADGR